MHLDIVEKNGTWFSFNGERLGQGRDAAKKYLLSNPKQIDVLRSIIHS